MKMGSEIYHHLKKVIKAKLEEIGDSKHKLGYVRAAGEEIVSHQAFTNEAIKNLGLKTATAQLKEQKIDDAEECAKKAWDTACGFVEAGQPAPPSVEQFMLELAEVVLRRKDLTLELHRIPKRVQEGKEVETCELCKQSKCLHGPKCNTCNANFYKDNGEWHAGCKWCHLDSHGACRVIFKKNPDKTLKFPKAKDSEFWTPKEVEEIQNAWGKEILDIKMETGWFFDGARPLQPASAYPELFNRHAGNKRDGVKGRKGKSCQECSSEVR